MRTYPERCSSCQGRALLLSPPNLLSLNEEKLFIRPTKIKPINQREIVRFDFIIEWEGELMRPSKSS